MFSALTGASLFNVNNAYSVYLFIVCVCSSYLHCEWATEQHLEKDKRIQQKIKRFKIKQAQRAHFFADVSV